MGSEVRRVRSQRTEDDLLYNSGMPDYRRVRMQGGTFFFTVVTFHRMPIFTEKKARPILKNAWMDVMERFPFTQTAVCLLPDHMCVGLT